MKTKILVIFISFIFLFTYNVQCFATTNIVNEEIEDETRNEETNDSIEKYSEEINKNEVIEKEDFMIEEQTKVEELNIGVANYSGLLFIDSPSENQSFNTRIDGNFLNISGWAVSNDFNTKLQCLLDGNIVSENFERVSRIDVDELISPPFGGTLTTPNAGFNCFIDISLIKTGTHIIKIRELSSDNQIICESEISLNIENQPYIGNMYIDIPIANQSYIKPDNSQITVFGWAVSDDERFNLQVFLDGKNINTEIIRTVREDIDNLISPSFGGKSTNPKSGFQTSIDISNYSIGNHSLRIKQLSRNNEILSESEVNFKIENKNYIGQVFIDNPENNTTYTRPDDENIVLQGWAVANDINSKLQVFVDGNVINTNIERFLREDIDRLISPQYGGTKETPRAGFQTDINISDYSQGKHTIKIKEFSKNNDFISEAEIDFFITNKKYNGNMFIDTPSENQTYTRPDIKDLALTGWAVSDDSNSRLQVLVDEKSVNSTIKKFQREDVDRLISPKYGGTDLTPQAGFQAIVDISYLNRGNHIIKIQEISRYGQVIFEISKNIKIENKRYSRGYMD